MPTCDPGVCNAFNTAPGFQVEYSPVGSVAVGAQAYFLCLAGYARLKVGGIDQPTSSTCVGTGSLGAVVWTNPAPMCSPCDVGFFAPQGATECLPCFNGYFAETPASEMCTICPPGYECTADTKAICKPGYFAAGGATRCTPCARGSYAPSSGASECLTCSEGHSCGGQQILSFRRVESKKKQVSCVGSRLLGSYALAPLIVAEEKDANQTDIAGCQARCLNTTGCTHAIVRADTVAPTATPTAAPTRNPTHAPTTAPTHAPTHVPTVAPTAGPTHAPTAAPSASPTQAPTQAPTAEPSTAPPSTARRRLQGLSGPEGTPATLPMVCDLCEIGQDEMWSVVLTSAGVTNVTRQDVQIYEGVRGAAVNETVCRPGTFAADIAQAECTRCANGLYNAAYGATGCLPCGEGNWSAVNAPHEVSECSRCAVGAYSKSPASSACWECSPGLFADAASTVECTKCSPGARPPSSLHRLAIAPRSLPHACRWPHAMMMRHPSLFLAFSLLAHSSLAAGTFSNDTASTTCLACRTGKSAMAEGSTTCSLCDAGKFTNAVSSSVCAQCTKGFISKGGLVTECTGCDPGKAAATRGSAVCVTCNEGWYSKANESECFICPLRGVKCSEGVLVVEDGCVDWPRASRLA